MNQREIGEPLVLATVNSIGGRDKLAGAIGRAAPMMDVYSGRSNQGWTIRRNNQGCIIGMVRGEDLDFGFWRGGE